MEIPKIPFFDLSHLNPSECQYIEKLHQATAFVVYTAIERIPVHVPGLDYHTRRHSEEDVVGGFMTLGKTAVEKDKLEMSEFYIGLVSAGTHDLHYEKELVGTGENESKSTDEALKLMKEHNIFTHTDMKRVAQIHEATVFKGAGKDGIVQNATEGNYLEELITDVDSGGIGMKWPEAKVRIDNFYREINEKEPNENDPDYLNFLFFQVDVLTGHSYKTQEGSSMYAYLRSNVEKINKIIARITN